jgi:hypothetical protein
MATDITGHPALTDLDALNRSGNADILCTDLDTLAIALFNSTFPPPRPPALLKPPKAIYSNARTTRGHNYERR